MLWRLGVLFDSTIFLRKIDGESGQPNWLSISTLPKPDFNGGNIIAGKRSLSLVFARPPVLATRLLGCPVLAGVLPTAGVQVRSSPTALDVREQCPGDGGLWAELSGVGGDVLLAESADLAGVFEPEAYGDGVFGIGG